MGRGIIETAVNNKNLHLDLEYRQPSMLGEGNASNEERATDTGLALQYDDPQASDGFASAEELQDMRTPWKKRCQGLRRLADG